MQNYLSYSHFHLKVEEPVRRRVLAGDECETPVRAATVHHNSHHQPTAAAMQLAARSPLIIDNGPSKFIELRMELEMWILVKGYFKMSSLSENKSFRTLLT